MMKRMIGLGVLLLSTCISVFSQVDTTYIYNTSMPYGTLDLRLAKSPTRYYYLQEDTTFSYRETSPGVRSTTYRDMTSWDSSPFKEGNLREKNGNSSLFVMNYRIMFPQGFNPAYEPGYPLILMLHGAGEAGNCWGETCHWSTRSWDPNANNPEAPSTELELLNNDRNLFHGGQIHMNAIKAAGTRLPNDPSMPSTAFPGIVIFPQSLNGWSTPAKVEDAIRIVRLIIRKYNVDQNRVYIHGLSNGGGGVNQAIKRAPWLFASSATMSAVTDGEIVLHNQLPEAKKIPMWIFQGGQDSNPTPSRTFNFVRKLRDAGAVVRYYLYPNLGHGTWNTAYKEPDFFTWILSNRKYNPHISYGNPVICNTTGTGVRMSFNNGFFAYQWEKDGVVISGENASEFMANTPGTYRGRFSRKSSSPSEDQWEPWSDPIVVSEIEPAKPSITVTGTTHLRGPGLVSNEANNTVVLQSGVDAELYNWYRNGQLINFQNTDIDDTLKVAAFSTGSTASNGAYTLVIKNSYCPSPPSDPVYLFFNNSAPVNITLSAAATGFKGQPTSSSVFLTWNDPLVNETGYEIWRRKSGTAEFRFVARTKKDAVSYLDHSLEPGTTYEYKLRAINNAGRSNYVPSDNVNTNYQVTTLPDVEYPAPPQNVRMTTNDITAISLAWEPASDNVGIKEYVITYGGNSIVVPAAQTSFTITGLQPNNLYPITIAARDFAGHLSESSNQVMGTTYVLSLKYKHSTGAWTDLDDTTLTKTFIHPEFQGTVDNFTLAPRTQEDFFNFQFTGYLNVATEGKYVFRLTSDDGSRLIIDSAVVIDNDGKHGTRTIISDSLRLTAGLHQIEVQYFDNNGFHTLTVQYAGAAIADGNTFINIPDHALKSGAFTPPTPPSAPINPVAATEGMQRITISWEFPDDESTGYEVYRSTSEAGPFTMVGRVEGLLLTDSVGLEPGTVYYYKVRSVSDNGVSDFTVTTIASTGADAVPPVAPAGLQILSKTYTTIALSWTASYDNFRVRHYEVFANGEFIGTSEINSFTATELTGITYSFTVRAIDVSGNASAFSAALVIDNTIAGMFYSLPSGNLNELSTWRKNADGNGPSPTSFTTAGQTFVINERAATGLGGEWTISSTSKVVVPDGVTLNLDFNCNCAIDIQGAGRLNILTPTIPAFASISETSTINIDGPVTIPSRRYGNLEITGTSKTVGADTVFVAGDMVVNDNVAITNSGNIKIYGNLHLNNSSAANFSNIRLTFSSHALHQINTNGDVIVSHISARPGSTIDINSQQEVQLVVGSTEGGGLTLHSGSHLLIKTNHLTVKDAGTINPSGENGDILTERSRLNIASNAASGSQIYFHPDGHSLSNLTVDLTNGGTLSLNSPVDVHETLKIKHGTLLSNGNLRLISDRDRTATVPKIEDGAVNGDVIVQRFLPVEGRIWRDITTTVEGVTVADLQNYFPVTGAFTGASTGPGLTSEPSMLRTSGNWTPVAFPAAGASNTAVLQKGTGYSILMHSLNDSIATVVEVQGPLNQGNISIPLIAGQTSTTGWNLVGNPYQDSIRWSDAGWVRSDVSPVIVVRESSNVNGVLINQYNYHHASEGTGILAPGQAFWVKAGLAPSLSVSEDAKLNSSGVTNTASGYFTTDLSGNGKVERLHFFVSETGVDSYDMNDGVKILNEGMFSFSSMTSESVKLAVNSISNSFDCARTIPLIIDNAEPGNYSLTFGNLSTLSGLQAFLNDKVSGTKTAISSSPYAFTITAGNKTQSANRFELVLTNKVLNINGPVLEGASVCHGLDAPLTLTNAQADVLYTLVNSAGTPISSPTLATSGLVNFKVANSQLVEGTNTFAVHAGFPGCQTFPLTTRLSIEHSAAMSVTVPPVYNVCSGQAVTIEASGAKEGDSYRWYNTNGQLIEGQSGSALVIQSANENASYFVETVNALSCVSVRDTTTVVVTVVAQPVINASGDTLSVSTAHSVQWFLDGAEISGVTGTTLVAADSGSYTVVASDGSCSATSVPYAFTPAPVNNNDDDTDDGTDVTDDDNTDNGEDNNSDDEEDDETDTTDDGDEGDNNGEDPGTDPDGEDPDGDGDADGEEPVVGTIPDVATPISMQVYPVPSDGTNLSIRLVSRSSAPITIRIISPTGKETFSKTFDAVQGETTLEVRPDDHLPNGVYLLTAVQGTYKAQRKILIRH